jgi:hypothetical protein
VVGAIARPVAPPLIEVVKSGPRARNLMPWPNLAEAVGHRVVGFSGLPVGVYSMVSFLVTVAAAMRLMPCSRGALRATRLVSRSGRPVECGFTRQAALAALARPWGLLVGGALSGEYVRHRSTPEFDG